MGRDEFSVRQFFDNGEHEYVRRFVSADEAVEAACHYITSVGARFGFVERVIITDGGDCTVFEWKKGIGITWLGAMTAQEWEQLGE
jgi:hypothetical protein